METRPLLDETVSSILASRPDRKSALAGLGIDLCCSGPLTLREAARARGLDPGRALEALAAGPPVACAPGHAPESPEPALLGFLKAALGSTLTLGATFGAYNLYALHLLPDTVPAEHHWVHASFQIWGFVFLFIAGVSFHAIPRFLGRELAWPRAARSTLWLALAGLVLSGYGKAGAILPGALPALVLGALLQFAAVLAWAGALGATWFAGPVRLAAPHPFLWAGTFWWLVAAGYVVASAGAAVAAGEPWASVAFHERIYVAALFGGTLSWILGMYLQTSPILLGKGPPGRRTLAASLATGFAAVLLLLVGASGAGGPGTAIRLFDAGLLALSASVLAFVVATRPFARVPGRTSRPERDMTRILDLAWSAAILFALLAGAYAASDLAGRSLTRLAYDGARHAFTLGFVTLAIYGYAGRVVPVLAGRELRWPALRLAGAYLIAAGVLLRQAEVVAMVHFEPWLLDVTGWSGIVAAAGVALASASILKTLGRARPAPVLPGVSLREPHPDVRVGDLLDAHPELLPVLVAEGFGPLANPVLRRTVARSVTLSQACSLHGKDAVALVERLRLKLAPPRAIELREPLAELLGAAPAGGTLRYTYEDAVKLAGHSCPTVARAWVLTTEALRALFPDEIPVRGGVEVVVGGDLADGSTGPLAQVVGFLTGAAGETGFGGIGGRHVRQGLLRFDPALGGRIVFQRTDTGDAVDVSWSGPPLPDAPGLGELLGKASSGRATPAELERFQAQWRERVEAVLDAPAGSVTIRRLECDAPTRSS